MNKYIPITVGIVVLAIVVGFVVWTKSSKQTTQSQPASVSSQSNNSTTSSGNFNFSNPKKSAHYESNTPAHASVLAGVPINVVIDFNFDLAKPSEIKILKDGKDYGTQETVIDTNKLAMRRHMSADSPDGLYAVEYKACWPDASCHNGNFQFAIDRSRANDYLNQTGQEEVTIKLSQIKFDPQNIKISKGTKVTWINADDTEHFVNTDSHPAHTYYVAQNSKALKKGDSFGLTFDQAGTYPYHCSAHASSMTSSLLVE